MSNLNSSLPLAGVRVLDLSRVLAGPWCATVLGDLGAEVIKIEHPQRGDDTRDWGLRVGSTQTSYFNSANRNKRSVTVDLQTAEGQQIVRDLAKQSDVVIQNFKFGGVEKMGLGYEQLKQVREDLIYCSISGYDRTGPEATRPGYDLVVQGEAGLMALNGEASQPPLKFGVAAVDLFTGMYSAQAILAALFERQRTRKGRHIEMALFDCGLMITSYYGLEALMKGEDPLRFGNAHPSIVPYGVFNAEDGPLVITVGNNGQYERFCREVIERPDLVDDERFRTNIGRAENRATLLPEIDRELGRRKRQDLLERLRGAGIPCGEVLGVHEALTSKRATDAGLVSTHDHPECGSASVLAPPYRLDGVRPPVRRAPPQLGEGTADVLNTLLGLSDERIAQLKAAGVV
ncbi:Acetyl-CoA:oxalate CoA-transferase [Paraburkholderia caffeinitolerans]|uniref:Acetyl-CoA:oxalate CoA-transferase n=1 Tax=Paraburkholderia caffeinitolerans TaxID=1723730 RepID=A0A6J5GB90_9BURK|nr:CaiB/BaiF CoA-transferase family protein [Paraburkholderia caffeinitolerans]CAB3793357.1 Acetyl-CoA:oxalate CoA-transferase [Paraburkholderia caffeinitolerans]